MNPRERLRLTSLPNLYEFGRKPSLAPTTTFEISDEEIGLKPDALAQTRAEEAIRAAIAFRTKQAEKIEIDRATQRARIVIAAAELMISVETTQGVNNELRRLSGFRPSHSSKQFFSEAAQAR